MQPSSHYSPYRGLWIAALVMLAVPIVLSLIIYLVLQNAQPQYSHLNPSTAQCIGFGLGSLYHFSCVLTGMLRESFRVVVFRVSEFFQNLTCSVRFAFREYWEDIKSDGVVFDVYLLIILGCLGYGVYNLVIALNLMGIR